MPIPLRMPKFEMSQEEGTIVNWLRKEGERVEKGEPVLEVETDKVVMEVDAPASGTISTITAQVGDRVAVTSVIALIIEEGEENTDQTSPNLQQPSSMAKEESVSRPFEGDNQLQPRRETPLAKRFAENSGIDIRQVPASKKSGRVTRDDVERYIQELPTDEETPSPPTGRYRATPAARRVAKETGVDLHLVRGSGPRSRIQEIDVRSFLETSAAEAVQAEDTREQVTDHPSISPIETGQRHAAPDAVEKIPLQGMRRTIAERMQHSYQNAPHVNFTVEVNMSRVSTLRETLHQRADRLKIPRIPITAIILRACAWALLRHPMINATLVDNIIYRYPSPNIGVAVALQDGLIVPVIRNADRLNLAEITLRLQDLIERAHQERLLPLDVTSGTFTISNLGMFGIDQFTAILNPPQCAILAVGRTVKKAVVVDDKGEDRIVIRPMMKVTLSADHRIVDGAVAAQFLRDLTAALEDPDLLLV